MAQSSVSIPEAPLVVFKPEALETPLDLLDAHNRRTFQAQAIAELMARDEGDAPCVATQSLAAEVIKDLLDEAAQIADGLYKLTQTANGN